MKRFVFWCLKAVAFAFLVIIIQFAVIFFAGPKIVSNLFPTELGTVPGDLAADSHKLMKNIVSGDLSWKELKEKLLKISQKRKDGTLRPEDWTGILDPKTVKEFQDAFGGRSKILESLDREISSPVHSETD